MDAADKIKVDAVIEAVLSELDVIFPLKEHEGSFLWTTFFLFTPDWLLEELS